MQYYLDNYLAVAVDESQFVARAYEHVLAWKGMVASRQKGMRAAADQPAARPKYAELQTVAQDLSRQALLIPAPNQRDDWRRRLQELSERKDRLQAELSRDSAEFRAAMRKATVVDVQAVIADSALIDFVEYDHWKPDKNAPGGRVWEKRLIAFVVRDQGSAILIEFGAARPIRSAVEVWRTGFGLTADSRKAADQLRALLWEPIEPHVAGAKHVLISPDGPINQLPIAVLPGKSPGTYLLEAYSLVVVPAPQLLPDLLAARSTRQLPNNLLVLGDVT